MDIRFIAYDINGKRIKEKSMQDTIEQFYKFIEEKNLTLIEYKILKNYKITKYLGKNRYRKLADLCSYLFYIENSGISINKGMLLISKSIKDKKFKKIILSIIDDVNGGEELYKCFEKYPMYFSHFFTEMIHTGEKTDNLQEIFKQLMSFYNELYTTMKELEKNLIYPIIVLATAIVSMILMRVIFIPEILSLLDNNGSALSMAKEYSFIKTLFPVIGLSFLSAVFIYMIKSKRFDIVQKKIYKLIPKNSLVNLIFRFKLLNSLYMAVICGETVPFGYEMALESVKDKYFKSQINNGYEMLKYGSHLSESLGYIEAIDDKTVATISIGEETNSLEKALKNSIDDSKIQMNNRIKKISVMVEPSIMILLGGFIAYYAISVFLPIMNNLNNI